MVQNTKISFLVDAPAEKMKGALDLPALAAKSTKVVEFEVEYLGTQIGSVIDKMQKAIVLPPDGDGPFEVGEVKFSLSVDAKGDVSVLSLAKVQLGGTATIEVTLQRRGESK